MLLKSKNITPMIVYKWLGLFEFNQKNHFDYYNLLFDQFYAMYASLRAVNSCVRFDVFTAVTMKNGVFWDVTSCGSCKNRRFGGT
jgi:hypothetical protein